MSPERRPTLQSIILQLQAFWADQGCLIWQPYHTEVGAGTMNPATFLRVLGPEPWWVAYVEPSFRPADGRYGENPNRWQHYYQFQVILKPDPGDPQERYLESLLALGVDPAKHDIRFVEDNWEAPTLGAWGLGWEVWLDGQEITQYTYFQQAGGEALSPVSVEITYGLERILQSLLDVDTFVDLPWDEHLTYGEVKLQPEVEYSRYNFETASIQDLNRLFEIYEREAGSALDQDLVQPAHDYVLKCSHVFNLLDARGAVGVTERAAIFRRMRVLAGKVANAYLAQRESLGHPWLGKWPPQPLPEEKASETSPPSTPADFVLEIGVEELPAEHAWLARRQLQELVPAMLDEHRLEHGPVSVEATPRRLVVFVSALAPAQAEAVTTTKGPPAERAFDEAGAPTAAAEGFARGHGVSVEALEVQELDGGRYVVATVRKPGQSATEVLAEALPGLIGSLSFPRGMRWNASEIQFSRPIRWLVAVHGEHVVPFEFAGVVAGRRSRGLRFGKVLSRDIGDAGEFPSTWHDQGIALETDPRREAIWEAVTKLAKQAGGELVEDQALLDEVTMLVEQPTAFLGNIDPEFLKLPRPVLLSVMRSHQRYFAIEDSNGLLPHFVAVRNGGDQHLDLVQSGNERVLRARLADATFFVQRDMAQPLEAYVDRLETLTFEASLGSMRDKVRRLESLVDPIADALGLDDDQLAAARRAAHLCKADLSTQMVVEMTSLQGEIGGIYADSSGEPEAVSTAIAEHYRPRYADDALPQSPAGITLSLADRLDSLVGLFAAGKQPSGSGDPYGLRRAAIGVIEILRAHDQSFDLASALSAAAELQPIAADESVVDACLDFFRRRQQALLLAQSHRHDAVGAVLAAQAGDPALAARAVDELERWIESDEWEGILQNYARCARITRALEQQLELDTGLIKTEATKSLYEAVQSAHEIERAAGSVDALLEVLRPLVPAIETFFDDVLVMDEDESLRTNRLALLQRIVQLADGVLDFSQLEGF